MKNIKFLFLCLFVVMGITILSVVYFSTVSFAACGLDGQNCCVGPQGNRFCTQPGTVCLDGKCRLPCGSQNEVCCPGPVPCKPNIPPLGCVNNKCQPICGIPGLPCCTSDPKCGAGLECFLGRCYVPLIEGAPCIEGSPPPCKSPNLECRNGRCTKVGVEDKPCKQGRVCTDGSVCYEGYCERQGGLNQPCANGNMCRDGLACAFARGLHASGNRTIGICKEAYTVGSIMQYCRTTAPQCNSGLLCQSGSQYGYCYKPCIENCSLKSTKTEIWYCDRWNTGTCKKSTGAINEPCLPTEPPSCQYGLTCKSNFCIDPKKGFSFFIP